MPVPKLACCFLFVSAITAIGLAQENAQAAPSPSPQSAEKIPEVAHYFRLEFVIQEVNAEGKPVNSRSYSTSISTEKHGDTFGQIRTGSRIPIVTVTTSGEDPAKKEVKYDYLNLGVNINTRNAHEVGNQLGLYIDANINSLAGGVQPTTPEDPVIRQNAWQAAVLIPVGKPTVVFASDSLESKGGMRIEVTATPLQ